MPHIASVNKFGTVTAHQKGRVRIRISSWDDAEPLSANLPVTYSKEGVTAELTLEISGYKKPVPSGAGKEDSV